MEFSKKVKCIAHFCHKSYTERSIIQHKERSYIACKYCKSQEKQKEKRIVLSKAHKKKKKGKNNINLHWSGKEKF